MNTYKQLDLFLANRMSRCDNPRFCRGANLALCARPTFPASKAPMNAVVRPRANPPRCIRAPRRIHARASRRAPVPIRASSRDDGASPEPPARDENSGGRETPSLESEFARVLREQTERATRAMETRWTQGGLRPRVVHESTSDWIRRVAFDWPNAVMGTAAGSVLVCNCEELGGLEYRQRARRLLARRKDAHSRDWRAVEDRGLGERSLLGLYDAGAVTAVAIAGKLVASGGRDGKLCAWRIPPGADVDDPAHPRDGETLRRVGAAEHPDVVTGAEFDVPGGCVWTSCLDGKIRRWGLRDDEDDEDDDEDDTKTLELLGEWSTGQAALCLSLDPNARILYAGTADGGAVALDAGSFLVANDDAGSSSSLNPTTTIGATLGAWTAHEDGVTRSVSHARGGCLTGSSTGAVYAWRVERAGEGRKVAPSLAVKMIGHAAAVVSISTGNPRHVVSGAHDGTVRVWNAPDLSAADEDGEERGDAAGGGDVKKSECLYAVTGHTVWLGSVQADETRIVCDGANNIAMCYDFSDDPDDNGDI